MAALERERLSNSLRRLKEVGDRLVSLHRSVGMAVGVCAALSSCTAKPESILAAEGALVAISSLVAAKDDARRQAGLPATVAAASDRHHSPPPPGSPLPPSPAPLPSQQAPQTPFALPPPCSSDSSTPLSQETLRYIPPSQPHAPQAPKDSPAQDATQSPACHSAASAASIPPTLEALPAALDPQPDLPVSPQRESVSVQREAELASNDPSTAPDDPQAPGLSSPETPENIQASASLTDFPTPPEGDLLPLPDELARPPGEDATGSLALPTSADPPAPAADPQTPAPTPPASVFPTATPGELPASRTSEDPEEQESFSEQEGEPLAGITVADNSQTRTPGEMETSDSPVREVPRAANPRTLEDQATKDEAIAADAELHSPEEPEAPADSLSECPQTTVAEHRAAEQDVLKSTPNTSTSSYTSEPPPRTSLDAQTVQGPASVTEELMDTTSTACEGAELGVTLRRSVATSASTTQQEVLPLSDVNMEPCSVNDSENTLAETKARMLSQHTGTEEDDESAWTIESTGVVQKKQPVSPVSSDPLDLIVSCSEVPMEITHTGDTNNKTVPQLDPTKSPADLRALMPSPKTPAAELTESLAGSGAGDGWAGQDLKEMLPSPSMTPGPVSLGDLKGLLPIEGFEEKETDEEEEEEEVSRDLPSFSSEGGEGQELADRIDGGFGQGGRSGATPPVLAVVPPTPSSHATAAASLHQVQQKPQEVREPETPPSTYPSNNTSVSSAFDLQTPEDPKRCAVIARHESGRSSPSLFVSFTGGNERSAVSTKSLDTACSAGEETIESKGADLLYTMPLPASGSEESADASEAATSSLKRRRERWGTHPPLIHPNDISSEEREMRWREKPFSSASSLSSSSSASCGAARAVPLPFPSLPNDPSTSGVYTLFLSSAGFVPAYGIAALAKATYNL